MSRAPKLAWGSCLHCGKGNATKLCGTCKANDVVSRYCSRECQRSNWSVHKPQCGTNAAGAKRSEVKASQSDTASLSVDAVLQGLSQSEGGNPGLHQLFTGKDWYEGLSVERQRERLLMSYQLRNEDAYMYRAEYLGPYNHGEDPMIEWRKYYLMAERKQLLPESCKGDFMTSQYARKMCTYSLEKSDVIEKFGYASGEHMVLRSMAEKITGTPTMGEMGGMGM